MTDYLQKILRARVYDVARETPLDPAPNLSQRLKNQIWLKREDLQPVFSFKLRGAYNRMVQLPIEDLQRGVIASSAGNHAQGVALSARRLGCRAVIVMPKTTPEVKIRAVRALGGEVVLHGETYDECSAEAQKRCAAEGLTYIHPFDDPEVIAGQGTIAMEIMRQSKEPPDAIYVAVGGGGLIAGISAYVKQLWPETEVIGVEPIDADAMTQSLRCGHRVELEKVGLFADGVAVRKVGEHTFNLARRNVDRMPSKYVTDAQDILGKVASRAINPNEVIRETTVAAQPVVKSGDRLMIIFETPNLRLTAPGMSLQKGALGDRIQVRNLQSKILVYATVRDKNHVQVN